MRMLEDEVVKGFSLSFTQEIPHSFCHHLFSYQLNKLFNIMCVYIYIFIQKKKIKYIYI